MPLLTALQGVLGVVITFAYRRCGLVESKGTTEVKLWPVDVPAEPGLCVPNETAAD